MDIKDINVGQTVYIKDGDVVHTEIIKKVGREYVYTRVDSWEEKYEVPCSRNEDTSMYLIEAKDWGDRKKLYVDREDIEIEKRMKAITKWLFDLYGGAKKHSYTIEQLEGAVKALDPDGKYKDEIEKCGKEPR